MKRQQRTVGAFVAIKLPNGKYGYGRILDKAAFAFYDLITNDIITDIAQIRDRPILFIVAAYDDIITKGRWLKIGKSPLENHLMILPMKYIQDPINQSEFRLYDPNTGLMASTTEDKCIGMEEAAVWEAFEVEQRILDQLEGKPNVWVKN
jgi:hypothetical protein